MKIIVDIQPHEDGVRCGECKGPSGENSCEWIWLQQPNNELVRGPACLAAERKLRALVEAVHDTLATGVPAAHLDSAVADMEGE